MKKFDIYTKSLDGVNQQTLMGALATVVAAVLIGALLFSEFSYFQNINVVSRLEVDKGVGLEAVKVIFDISFPRVMCDRISFSQEVTRGSVHSKETPQIDKVGITSPSNPAQMEGCRVAGSMVIDKLSGNFKVAVPVLDNHPLDLTHTINYVSFLPTTGKLIPHNKLPDASSNITDLAVTVPSDTGLYHYTVQVIPTQYKEIFGDISHMNQYSLSEKVLTVDQARRGGDMFNPLPVHDFTGILFSYDFHPVSLVLSSCCHTHTYMLSFVAAMLLQGSFIHLVLCCR